MSASVLKITMLGSFSMDWNGRHIDDEDNRSRKSWQLLAYLLCHRDRAVSRQELIDSLWEDSEKNANPQSAVKTLTHRVRNMLDALGENAGYRLIVLDNNGYRISNDIPMEIDTETFSSLYNAAQVEMNLDTRLEYEMQAVSVFQGQFLPKLSTEPWVIPLGTYYHDRFLSVAQHAANLLYDRERYADCASVCRSALSIEAYHEELNLLLLKALDATGDREALVAAYDRFSSLLYNNFGISPCEEASALYRNAMSSGNASCIPADMLFEQLREDAPRKGAIVCDYDMLRRFYQVEARQAVRNGDACHIAMFTIDGIRKAELTRRIRENAMNNLQEVLRSSLRSGDMVARCSSTQFVVLLPQANYENSCMVCERVHRSFFRQYPHAAVEITTHVQPMIPVAL